MKNRLLKIIILLSSLLLVRCESTNSTGGTETGNPTTDGVNLAIANSLDSVSSQLQSDSNTLALLSSRRPTGSDYLVQMLTPIRLAYADLGTGSCSDSDPAVTVTIDCDEEDHAATMIKDFGSGCAAESGVTITGKRYTTWLNMGEGACVSRTRRPRFYRAIQGAGARQIVATDTITASGSCLNPSTAVTRRFSDGGELQIAGCGEIDYSNIQTTSSGSSATEAMTLSENRIRLKPNGDTLFDHTISTPTPMTITISRDISRNFPTRTIASGEIEVSHNLARYTVRSRFEDVQYDYNVCECHPVSGTITVSVTDDTTGTSLGSGRVTFTQTETGNCNSLDATYDGARVSLPLGNCRGF